MSDACANCGYELTGLKAMGKCPECGVFFSRHTGENIKGGDQYSRRQAELDRKLTWMKVGALCGLAVLAAGGGLVASLWWTGGSDRWAYMGLVAAAFLLLWAATAFAELRSPR